MQERTQPTPAKSPKPAQQQQADSVEAAPRISAPLLGTLSGVGSSPGDGLTNRSGSAKTRGATDARLVIQLQHVHGNRHVQRLLAGSAQLQRQQAAPPPSTPDTAASGEVWKIPAGMIPDFIAMDPGPITDKAMAANVLFLAHSRMEELKDEIEASEFAPVQSAMNAIDTLRKRLMAEGALEHSDVIDLNIIVPGAKKAFDTALQNLRDIVSQAVASLAKQFGSADTSVAEEQIAEKLHAAFTAGAAPEAIKKAKEVLAKIKEYKEKIDDVAEWAERLAKLAKAAKITEFLENFGKKSKSIGSLLGKLGTVLDVAEVIASLTSSYGAQTEAQQSIQQCRVGLKAIDAGMGVAGKIFPPLGALWTNYYSPMFKACLDAAQKFAGAQDLLGRHVWMMMWWQTHEPPTLPPPTDADSIKLRALFPGGQAVLTFMYNLVNGGGAKVTPEVEQFFVERKDLFNIGEDDKDKLKTESNWHWYNPASWGNKDTSPNLMSWVTRHADVVWAQLYGSLPHSLRSR